MLDEGAGSGPITGVGIGMPGPFDYERGISLIRGQDKFDSLYGMDVGAQIRRRLELPAEVPVRFINDAVAFALGECLYGAGRGFDRVLAITLGTGFGCALVERSGAVAWEVEAYAMPYRDRRVDDYLSRRGILSLWRSKVPVPKQLYTTPRSRQTWRPWPKRPSPATRPAASFSASGARCLRRFSPVS